MTVQPAGPPPEVVAPERDELRRSSLAVLEANWDESGGYTAPHPERYGPQWLWDSAFHAVCWAHLGRRDRAGRELHSALAAQHADGFVPHMRYPRAFPGCDPLGLWGRSDASTITQPPLVAHALARLVRDDPEAGNGLVAPVRRSMAFLLRERPRRDGLVAVVHPWESGCDDSPRWDAWRPEVGGAEAWRAQKVRFAQGVVLNGAGSSVANPLFEVGSVGFNALLAFSLRELAAATGDGELAEQAAGIVDALEARFDGATWVDAPDSASSSAPTLDALLPLLVVRDRAQAAVAFDALVDPSAHAGAFGLRYVRADHASFDPAGYWRGSAWMPLQYLFRLAARRWGRDDLAERLATSSGAAAVASGFAEHYDADTGAGLGAAPQSWAALAAVVADG